MLENVYLRVYIYLWEHEKSGMVGGRGGSMAGGRDHKFGNSLPCGSLQTFTLRDHFLFFSSFYHRKLLLED